MTLPYSKELSALLHGITMKHKGDFLLFELSLLFQNRKLKFHEKVCNNKTFCGIVMPSVKDNVF